MGRSSPVAAAIRGDGDEVEFAAFIWQQGEGDATRQDWADAFETNLTDLIAQRRRDLKSPGLKVLLPRITVQYRWNGGPLPYAATVRQVVVNIAQHDPLVC